MVRFGQLASLSSRNSVNRPERPMNAMPNSASVSGNSAKTSLDPENRAGEADPPRREPPPSDRFAQDEQGQQRDEDRGKKDERVDLGERNGSEGIGAQEARDDAADHPQQDPLWMVH